MKKYDLLNILKHISENKFSKRYGGFISVFGIPNHDYLDIACYYLNNLKNKNLIKFILDWIILLKGNVLWKQNSNKNSYITINFQEKFLKRSLLMKKLNINSSTLNKYIGKILPTGCLETKSIKNEKFFFLKKKSLIVKLISDLLSFYIEKENDCLLKAQ